MSVLVKGMLMPSCCALCIFFNDYGYCTIADQYCGESATHGLASFCPLVEIKDPHGDLIDRDKLLNATVLNPNHAPYITIRDVNDMTEVIEAEGEEE